jgi:uncharacterized protein (TIGR00369 family)
MAGAAAASTMAGLEYLRAIQRGEYPPPPLAELLGFRLAEVERGRAVFELEPAEYHYNPIGTVHGGVAATLLDSVMGCAVHSTLAAGVGYTSVDLHVHFVRPLTADTGRVRCEGAVVHAGSRMATAEGRLVGADSKLYAHGTATCLLLDRPTAARSDR